MNALPAFAAVTLSALAWSHAQNVIQEPQEDPVQKAIREFNQRDKKKPNEVSVVLDPVGEPPTPVEAAAKPEATPGKTVKSAVLVTGTPPEESELLNKTEDAAPTPPPLVGPPQAASDEPTPTPQKGLAVRVEKIQAGTGNFDATQVKLLAPFPAKPLAPAPTGWRLESSENTPPFTRELELSPGKKITLKIRPHLLVPEADGTEVFNVQEPGFDAALGYRQNATAGAILADSIRQLEDDSKRLGSAIENLQQLLVSLPKPEPEPTEKVRPASIPSKR